MGDDDIDPNLVVEVDSADPDVQAAERDQKEALDKLQARTTEWLNKKRDK